jgi:hypothetical protein
MVGWERQPHSHTTGRRHGSRRRSNGDGRSRYVVGLPFTDAANECHEHAYRNADADSGSHEHTCWNTKAYTRGHTRPYADPHSAYDSKSVPNFRDASADFYPPAHITPVLRRVDQFRTMGHMATR